MVLTAIVQSLSEDTSFSESYLPPQVLPRSVLLFLTGKQWGLVSFNLEVQPRAAHADIFSYFL